MSNTLNGFDDDSGFSPGFGGSQPHGLSSSVLMTAVLCLVFVIVLITILHLYARHILRRQHAQRLRLQHAQSHRAATRGAGFVVAPQLQRPKTGLDPTAVASLPKFAYKKNSNHAAGDSDVAQDDCPVCLSQMEEGETVRRLPACGHTFHDGCIDMWLYSHNTCPLCRKVVGPISDNPPPAAAPAVEVVVVVQTGGGGEGNHGSSRPPLGAQPTSSQLLVPPAAASCGVGSEAGHSGHVEDRGAPSRLATFRRMFSLESAGGRRQQQDSVIDGPHRDLERR